MLRNYAALSVIAQGMVDNAFEDRIDDIQQVTSLLCGNSQRHTFAIHMGSNLTTHSRKEEDGVVRLSVGDVNGVFVDIIDHGTELVGHVSVYLSTIIETVDSKPRARIVLEVYPLKADDDPVVGLIWMDDNQTPGMSPSVGTSIVWSAQQFSVPGSRFPVAITNHTLQGFTLGIVAWNEVEDSIQIIGSLLDQPRLVTPMGIATGKVVDTYPIFHPKNLRKPDDMKPLRFNILETLFASGVKICSADGAMAIFGDRFSAEEASKLVTVLYRMAKDGWFTIATFRDKKYFVPTPKLLVSIQ